jgi:hypothetical protein
MGGGSSLYSQIRRRADFRNNPTALWFLGKSVRRVASSLDGTLLVSHPLIAAILRDDPALVYQHGELVLPAEAIVNGQGHFIVPLAAQADELRRHGLKSAQIIVSGLCIEPGLAAHAKEMVESRLRRYQTDTPLTGAFFSSGAEPAPHVELLTLAADAIADGGGNCLVFAHTSGRFARRMSTCRLRSGITILTYQTRAELDQLTADYFPQFDYFLAPAHERTNWALGLGLPMFILEPCIGSFAPLNRDLLLRYGAAEVIAGPEQAATLPERLKDLRRSGGLESMTLHNYGSFAVNGFQTIAEWLMRQK